MAGCSATCASTTPKAGDQFIFRGGDTWHFGNSSVLTYVGSGGWGWSWSGTSASPIYIGVDQTWYAGGSWARPVLTGDNATSGALVGSCAHASPTFFNATDQSYVTIDNFEWTGRCDSGAGPDYIWYGRSGPATGNAGMTVSNNYFHGWTLTSGGQDVSYAVQGYADNTGANPATVVSNNVIDGSDSYCTGANACSGGFLYGDCTYVTNNVVRYVANVGVCNDTLVFAGNNVQYVYESFGSTHGNVMEWLGFGPSGTNTMYVYNNLIANATIGETIDINIASIAYTFNNVYFNNGNPANCHMDESANGATVTQYHFNNTYDNPCTVRIFQTFIGTEHFQNLHIVSYSPATISSLYNNEAGASVSSDGSYVFQTESTASGQGYTPSNNYAPTASSDATVSAGANLTSRCNSMGYTAAASACKAGNAAVSYDSTNHIATVPNPAARPSSGNWDVGAYQYGAAVTVNPPTGLSATVN